jgi:hypothetical protein
MVLKEVRPGLYVRTNTPRHVRITPEFAENVRREGRSDMLDEIVEQATRKDGAPEKDRRK